jgi:hypothetical protein
MAKKAENTAFVLAVALLGVHSEQGSSRYIKEKDFNQQLNNLKEMNPKRFEKEIAPYL